MKEIQEAMTAVAVTVASRAVVRLEEPEPEPETPAGA
jgi:hypothetical protein